MTLALDAQVAALGSDLQNISFVQTTVVHLAILLFKS